MARTFDFFNINADFKEVVPGIESSTTLISMQASHERSKQKIKKIITPDIYDQLKTAFEGTPNTEEGVAIEYLQGAHGNRIAYHEIISKVIHKKKEEVSYYKYEIHMQQENYLDAYAVNMDELLNYFDANTASFPGWDSSDTYKLRQGLLLKSSDEFNLRFPTGGSAYFFNMLIPIQDKIIKSDIIPRVKIEDIPAADLESFEYYVAYKTMSEAVCLVDYADFPNSIRQKLYIEEGKKKGYEMESIVKRYCDMFNQEANKYLQRIDICLQTTDETTDISVPEENFNCESDKTYVIS